MRKLFAYLIAGLISLTGFIGSTMAHAEGTDAVAGPNRAFVGIGWDHDRGRITNGGGSVNSNPYNGLVGWSYKGKDTWYAAANFGWRGGSYDGTVSDWSLGNAEVVVTSVSAPVKGYQNGWNADARVGYTFSFGQVEEFSVTPYVGYGYEASRISVRGNAAFGVSAVAAPSGQFDETGGKFRSHNSYIPLGVQFDWNVVPEFTVGLKAEAQFVLGGKTKVQRDDGDAAVVGPPAIPATYVGTKVKMTRGTNWLFEVPLTYAMTSTWDLSLVPYYLHSKEDALHYAGFVERSDNWGARLEVGYRF